MALEGLNTALLFSPGSYTGALTTPKQPLKKHSRMTALISKYTDNNDSSHETFSNTAQGHDLYPPTSSPPQALVSPVPPLPPL